MAPYTLEVCERMKAFYDSLSEKDRRRCAAVEAEKLGHGGVEYVASVPDCTDKTIRHGRNTEKVTLRCLCWLLFKIL